MFRSKFLVLCFFFIGLCGFSMVNANQASLPLLGNVIYLDPGHGGMDSGAMHKEIKEKDINLEITQLLASRLEQLGAVVYMTRYGDYDLSQPYTDNRKRSDLAKRAKLINDSNCDLYLSIHLNAEESSSWHGAEVYYNENHKKNKKIAEIMQKQFEKDLKTKRKLKVGKDLFLFDRIKQPGVLLELGFLSNPNDRYLLKQKDYQAKIVDSITEGILLYF